MNQKEQIQLAFEICDRISRLESALWDQYHKEFLDIVMDEEDAKSWRNDNQFDDVF
jgi:hypothetical protein